MKGAWPSPSWICFHSLELTTSHINCITYMGLASGQTKHNSRNFTDCCRALELVLEVDMALRLIPKVGKELAMVEHAFNPSMRGRQSQMDLYEYEASLVYIVTCRPAKDT